MKHRTLFLSLLFFILISCNSKKHIAKEDFSISIIESYSAIQLFPVFLEANTILFNAKKDSILKHPSGNRLLDKLNQDTTQEGSSINDYPFWQVFIPQTYQGKDGNNYVDNSSILGFSKTDDTTKLLQYLHDIEISKLFPSDIDFIFSKGVMMNGYLKIHGIKKNSIIIQLDNSDIYKIIVEREGISGLTKGMVEVDDSKYSIKLQLDNKILSQLISDTYTIIIKFNDNLYSGSIVKDRINDLIFIGEVEKDILEIFKNEFKDKIEIE
jgi:hypothetical protein